MDWEKPPSDFHYVLFERVDPEKNINRFYYLGWTRTIFDAGAVIRLWGRKGGQQQTVQPAPFDSLDEAWPLIRSIIKARLRNGYRVVEPVEFAQGG